MLRYKNPSKNLWSKYVNFPVSQMVGAIFIGSIAFPEGLVFLSESQRSSLRIRAF